MGTTSPKICGRLAKPASVAHNLAKTLVQIVLFWGFFLFVLPAVVYRVEDLLGLSGYRFTSPVWKAIGTVFFLLMSTLGLSSALAIVIRGDGTPLPSDCTRALVVSGPYRYVRNPMAIAGLSQGVAVGVFLGSPLVLLYALAGMFGWNYLVRPWEERDLEERFGEPYRRYRHAVRCWIPNRRGYLAQND